jgi:hypothetical protein
MEAALESSDESRVVALDYPYLRRTKSLEADMVMLMYVYVYIHTYIYIHIYIYIYI